MVTGIASVWLPVDDLDRAIGFYGDTLGLRVTKRDEGWAELDAGGVMIGLNAREAAGEGSAAGGAVVSFRPDGSLEDEVSRLQAAGVEFDGGVSEHPWGRIAAFRDGEGNPLQLYAPPA